MWKSLVWLAGAVLIGAPWAPIYARVQDEPLLVIVDGAQPHQVMEGLGASLQSLSFAGEDYLSPEGRAEAIKAIFGEVRLNMGTVGALLESPGGYEQRRNDDDDPRQINWRGFDDSVVSANKRAVIDAALSHGFQSIIPGEVLNTRWASPWLATLRTSNYARYVDEAAEQAVANQVYWRDTYGIVPEYQLLFNEPLSGNAELVGGTERDIVDITRRAGAALREAGFPDVKFVISSDETEETSLRVANAVLADPEASQYVGAIGYHTYPYGSMYASVPNILRTSGAGMPDKERIAVRSALRDLARQSNVPLWMTEVSHGDVDARSYDSFRARAIHIHDELRYADASAYFGMLSMWNTRAQREHTNGNANIFLEDASIALIDDVTGTVHITGMGRAIGHYARWIRQGAVRLGSATNDPLLLASAFRDDSEGRVVVVILNNASTDREVRLRVENLDVLGTLTGEVSSPTEYWAPLGPIDPTDDGEYVISVPALGVVTVSSGL